MPISGLKFSKIRQKSQSRATFGSDGTGDNDLIEEKEEDVYISFAEVISARNDHRGSVIDLTIKKPKKKNIQSQSQPQIRPKSDSSDCSIIRNQFLCILPSGFGLGGCEGFGSDSGGLR